MIILYLLLLSIIICRISSLFFCLLNDILAFFFVGDYQHNISLDGNKYIYKDKNTTFQSKKLHVIESQVTKKKLHVICLLSHENKSICIKNQQCNDTVAKVFNSKLNNSEDKANTTSNVDPILRLPNLSSLNATCFGKELESYGVVILMTVL